MASNCPYLCRRWFFGDPAEAMLVSFCCVRLRRIKVLFAF